MITLFLIQKARTNKRGLASIRTRITINKSRKEFSTGVFVRPEFWSKENQKVLDPEYCILYKRDVWLI